MTYDIVYSKKAEDDAAVLYVSAPDDYKKFELIIEELKVHPRTGIGRPKRLHPKKGNTKMIKSGHVVSILRIALYIKSTIRLL